MMICDLPDDLEEEILSRVPAKSPRFVEKNKRLGKAVRESMLVNNHVTYSIAGDLHNCGVVEPPIEFTGLLKHSKDSNFSLIFYCEGLVLCSIRTIKTIKELVVWNPCTGQRRNIKARTCYRRNDTYALGYSTSSSAGHRYKILRYQDKGEQVLVSGCEIYELCSDSWRVLDSYPCGYSATRNGMSLRGDAYFVARDKKTDVFLMKFDFKTERFVRLPLPIQSFYLVDDVLLSVVRDEKLSLLHFCYWSGVMRIWVTNKFDDEAKHLSWRSDLVLDIDFRKFNLDVQSFLLDEENRVAICRHR